MSKQGITFFAKQLENLQEARGELFRMAGMGPTDAQDVRLGQMLDEMKDLVKEEFCKITVE